MNKQKSLQLITEIKNQIQQNVKEKSKGTERLYINSWVIGELDYIQNKIKTGEIYTWESRENQTYEKCFKDFFNNYFCLRIDPSIKIYTIAILFTFEIRNLIVDLYHALFTKQQREKMLQYVSNSIGVNTTNMTETDAYYTREFEYIRRYFNNGIE